MQSQRKTATGNDYINNVYIKFIYTMIYIEYVIYTYTCMMLQIKGNKVLIHSLSLDKGKNN